MIILGWLIGLVGLVMSAGSVVFLLRIPAQAPVDVAALTATQAITYAVLAHVAAAVCGGVGAVLLRKPDVRGVPLFEIVLAVFMPCVGGSLAWLHAAGQRVCKPQAVSDDFAEYIDASVRLGEQKLPEVRASEHPNPDFLAPMSDVLNSDASDDDKRIAVEALTRLETPAAIAALQAALTNESTEVRFYAASALAKLEERLQMRLKTLEDHAGKKAAIDPAAEVEMARTCYDYAYYQVADSIRRTQFLERAVEHARHGAERGADPGAWVVSGRALLELRRYEEAEEAFDKYLSEAGESAKGLLWRAEARFRRGDYAGVHADCARAEELGNVPGPMKEAVAMWA